MVGPQCWPLCKPRSNGMTNTWRYKAAPLGHAERACGCRAALIVHGLRVTRRATSSFIRFNSRVRKRESRWRRRKLLFRSLFQSRRWLCYCVPCPHKPRGALCPEEDVCQQRARPAGVQTRDSNNGESFTLNELM